MSEESRSIEKTGAEGAAGIELTSARVTDGPTSATTSTSPAHDRHDTADSSDQKDVPHGDDDADAITASESCIKTEQEQIRTLQKQIRTLQRKVRELDSAVKLVGDQTLKRIEAARADAIKAEQKEQRKDNKKAISIISLFFAAGAITYLLFINNTILKASADLFQIVISPTSLLVFSLAYHILGKYKAFPTRGSITTFTIVADLLICLGVVIATQALLPLIPTSGAAWIIFGAAMLCGALPAAVCAFGTKILQDKFLKWFDRKMEARYQKLGDAEPNRTDRGDISISRSVCQEDRCHNLGQPPGLDSVLETPEDDAAQDSQLDDTAGRRYEAGYETVILNAFTGQGAEVLDASDPTHLDTHKRATLI